MANSSKIVLYLKDSKSPRAPLDDFSSLCSALRNCLTNVARCIEQEGETFVVSDLAVSSALVEVEPKNSLNGATEISNVFLDTVEAIQEGRTVDERIDYAALYCFNGFTRAAKSNGLKA